MPVNLRNRHFLALKDFTKEEIAFLLTLSHDLKRAKYAGFEKQLLKGKNIVLIFEKDSTRTRCAFEVAAFDQGAQVTYLGPSGSQMGKKESIEDTARVLGRYYDGIEFRGFKQEAIEALATYSGVVVWNGLTDRYHPTQILADFMTIQEKFSEDLTKVSLTFVGDGRNNVANSLLTGCAIMGMDIRLVSPQELFPSQEILDEVKGLADFSGARISLTDSIKEGTKGAHVIYTDVWVSMGEEDEFDRRIELLKDYQVNQEMMKGTGNPNTIFMHCLPACHDLSTSMGREVYERFGLKEMEVSDEVFQSKESVVFDQAENRLHTIKAVMVATLGY